MTLPNGVQPGQTQPGQAGNPPSDGAGQQEPGTDNQPQYVTRQEMLKELTGVKKSVRKSTTDIIETKVLGKLKDMGVEVTDDQVSELRQAIIEDDSAGQQQQPSPSESSTGQQAAQPGAQQDPGAPNPLDQDIDEIMAKYGVTLYDQDPEANDLDYSSPKRLLDSVEAAAKAKSDRLAGEQYSNATARTPAASSGGTVSNPIADITDPSELIKMGLANKR